MNTQGVQLFRYLHALRDYKSKLQMDLIKAVIDLYLRKIL